MISNETADSKLVQFFTARIVTLIVFSITENRENAIRVGNCSTQNDIFSTQNDMFTVIFPLPLNIDCD